jgi:hypothetical protein
MGDFDTGHPCNFGLATITGNGKVGMNFEHHCGLIG